MNIIFSNDETGFVKDIIVQNINEIKFHEGFPILFFDEMSFVRAKEILNPDENLVSEKYFAIAIKPYSDYSEPTTAFWIDGVMYQSFKINDD